MPNDAAHTLKSAPSRAKASATAQPIPESPPGNQRLLNCETVVTTVGVFTVVRPRLHCFGDSRRSLLLLSQRPLWKRHDGAHTPDV